MSYMIDNGDVHVCMGGAGYSRLVQEVTIAQMIVKVLNLRTNSYWPIKALTQYDSADNRPSS